MKIFAAFKSLCSIFLSCKDFKPFNISISAFHISYSGILEWLLIWLLTNFIRSPPLAYSITIHKEFDKLSKNAYLNFTMYSSFNEAKILISFNAFYFYLSFIPKSLTFFSAYTWLSSLRLTTNTCPNAPSPSFFWI